ncbi:MAG: UvrD-helicase domain-containing protein [Patescibacteria group bacterium]
MKIIGESLNKEQARAAAHKNGPLIIMAGAGAGKTKTIVHRILSLIRGGVVPQEILAVTFTNKAAAEMRERVLSLLNKEGGAISSDESPIIKTFHSLGVYILKEQAKLLGLSRHFAILDEGESVSFVKEAINDEGLDVKQFEPRRIRNVISRYKGDLVSVEEFARDAEGFFPKTLARIWVRYEKKLAESKALDFDDLISKTVGLLRENKEVRENYAKRFRFIHIDEYQDTNEAQYELSKLLANEHKNICVVGDSDQNIYGWRGANMKNILNFERDYPGAEVVVLEENYRSSGNILEAANQIIKKNTIRKDKTLFTRKDSGERIGLFEAMDEADEANFVAGKIISLMGNGVKPERIAVLYRANFQSRVFEESLLGASIPYQVMGVRFFDRKEIKDALSYFRLAFNPESLPDMKRALNYPPRGIGKMSFLKIASGKTGELPRGTKEKFGQFKKFIDELSGAIPKEPPSRIVTKIIKESGMEKLLQGGTEEDKERLGNLYELAALAARYDTLPLGEGADKLLEDAALFAAEEVKAEDARGVKLMTVHAAKGLEFSHVFITGLEQDLFPHSRVNGTGATKEDEEEERRLFYVALTRAEKKLFLSYAAMRTVFGSRQVNTPSEFIFDMPPELLEQEKRENAGKVIHIE